MKPKVCILDYGSGNVRSVSNLITHLGYEGVVSNQPDDITQATHLILPGVGAFGAAMKKIREKLPLELLEQEVLTGSKPFLGICVGMQVLADVGHEFGKHAGLGWIPGEVRELDSRGEALPHIGWNDIILQTPCPLTKGLGEVRDFYFVHSYAFAPQSEDCVKANVEYGTKFAAIIQRDNLYGVQFHPEKSQKAGQQLIMNFLALS
jgi:imidazole glycerol-phosphate synthase subunit HisH